MHGAIDYGYGFFLARGQGVQAIATAGGRSVLADNA
jgi:hypothetical protein